MAEQTLPSDTSAATPATTIALFPEPPPARQAPPSTTNSQTTMKTSTQAQQAAHIAGAPARQYLNEFVTPYLLEGMKILAREQPSKPLEVLGRFLLEKSAQIDSASAMGLAEGMDIEVGTGAATDTTMSGS